MTLKEFNELPARDAIEELLRCCGSKRWAEDMTTRRPFRGFGDLHLAAEEVWINLTPTDWKEAFAHHPKIGDIKSLRKKFGSTAQWASGEQAGITSTTERVLKALADGNKLYEAKFGYIFIVCATGRSAEEMLIMLNARLDNYPADELKIAAREQGKITRLRLEKLLTTT